MIKDLNHLLSIHHFLNKAFGTGQLFLLSYKVMAGLSSDYLYNPKHKEGSKNNHQAQPKGVIQHNGNYRNHCNQGRNSLRNTDRDKLSHGINVIGIMTHDIPGFVLVEKGNGQILHMIKEFLSILF